jgi:hypothetical protein
MAVFKLHEKLDRAILTHLRHIQSIVLLLLLKADSKNDVSVCIYLMDLLCFSLFYDDESQIYKDEFLVNTGDPLDKCTQRHHSCYQPSAAAAAQLIECALNGLESPDLVFHEA